MPTFTAIALDRLLEPGASRFSDKNVYNSKHIKNTKDTNNTNQERRNCISEVERKPQRLQISPTLYATPEPTPLPDSPISFSPDPYIINHKRRGPRLLKNSVDDIKVSDTSVMNSINNGVTASSVHDSKVPDNVQEYVRSNHDSPIDLDPADRKTCGPFENLYATLKTESNYRKHETNSILADSNIRNVMLKPDDPRKDVDSEDFFSPCDLISATSNGTDNSLKLSTPMGEFYDAWEELSSWSGSEISNCDVEAELVELKASLLKEIEKRKQAEETLINMQIQWEHMRQQLAIVGFTLPCSASMLMGEQLAADLGQQVYIARFVSHSIGMGMAKAEMEPAVEAQVEAKNFEIARLSDRLQYYEAVNREMSQRNQEAIELARRGRQIKRQRQRWIWGSIAAAITLGSAALAWSYLPSENTSDYPQPSLSNDAAKQ